MDIRQDITNKIIGLLEQGGSDAIPQLRRAANRGFPINGKTRQGYRGANVLVLWIAALEHGYIENVWLTYKQAEHMGARVRKGETGTPCVYFDVIEREAEEDGATTRFPMAKPFWLFNVAQIDDLPEALTKPPLSGTAFTPHRGAQQLLAATGATILHGGLQAYYRPSADQICLPWPEAFTAAEHYYATALHELVHWTGHESRLNRQFGKRFGDEAYGAEELVAELGAAFLAAHLGFVDATLQNHATYIEHWLSLLRRDKNAIFTTSKHASLAYDYLVQSMAVPEVEAAGTADAT